MKTQRFIILFTIILIAATNVFAFNGQRHGFIVGLGVGPSSVKWRQTVSSNSHELIIAYDQNFSINTDFKIGYGFKDDRTLIYYWNKVSWFHIINAYEEDVVIASGITGLGISYYFKSTFPAFYASLGGGVSSWLAPFEMESVPWIGYGFIGGGGCEIIKGLNLEFTFGHGIPQHNDEETDVIFRSHVNIYSLTVNYLWY